MEPIEANEEVRWTKKRVTRLLTKCIAVFLLIPGIFLFGCLPPDWNFCSCYFPNNNWYSIISDLHVYMGKGLGDKMRNKQEPEWSHFRHPPDMYACSGAPMTFWKAHPAYGMTPGLIENSASDLWMASVRDLFVQQCIPGHIGLLLMCSQHWLAVASEQTGDEQMATLNNFFHHLFMMRAMVYNGHMRQCLPTGAWPLYPNELAEYAKRWVGDNSNDGQNFNPQVATMGGQVDVFQMFYNEDCITTPRDRVLPPERACTPYKDPACWKRHANLVYESCQLCCSPFEAGNEGGYGNPWCWDEAQGWTYERCCQQDFAGLTCETERKGEEGGCVDCAKSVVWKCLTPAERRLEDAIKKYNKALDKVDEYKAKTEKLYWEGIQHQQKLQPFFDDYHNKFNEFIDVDQRYVKIATMPERQQLVNHASQLSEIQNQSLDAFRHNQEIAANASRDEKKLGKILVDAKNMIKKQIEDTKVANTSKNSAQDLLDKSEEKKGVIEEDLTEKQRLEQEQMAAEQAAKQRHDDNHTMAETAENEYKSKEEGYQNDVNAKNETITQETNILNTKIEEQNTLQEKQNQLTEEYNGASLAHGDGKNNFDNAERSYNQAESLVNRSTRQQSEAHERSAANNQTLSAAAQFLADEEASLIKQKDTDAIRCMLQMIANKAPSTGDISNLINPTCEGDKCSAGGAEPYVPREPKKSQEEIERDQRRAQAVAERQAKIDEQNAAYNRALDEYNQQMEEHKRKVEEITAGLGDQEKQIQEQQAKYEENNKQREERERQREEERKQVEEKKNARQAETQEKIQQWEAENTKAKEEIAKLDAQKQGEVPADPEMQKRAEEREQRRTAAQQTKDNAQSEFETDFNKQFEEAESKQKAAWDQLANNRIWKDTDESCGPWAQDGECTKNSKFMFKACNASCRNDIEPKFNLLYEKKKQTRKAEWDAQKEAKQEEYLKEAEEKFSSALKAIKDEEESDHVLQKQRESNVGDKVKNIIAQQEKLQADLDARVKEQETRKQEDQTAEEQDNQKLSEIEEQSSKDKQEQETEAKALEEAKASGGAAPELPAEPTKPTEPEPVPELPPLEEIKPKSQSEEKIEELHEFKEGFEKAKAEKIAAKAAQEAAEQRKTETASATKIAQEEVGTVQTDTNTKQGTVEKFKSEKKVAEAEIEAAIENEKIEGKNRTKYRKAEALAKKALKDAETKFAQAETSHTAAVTALADSESNFVTVKDQSNDLKATLDEVTERQQNAIDYHTEAKANFQAASTLHRASEDEVAAAEKLLPKNVTKIIEDKFAKVMSPKDDEDTWWGKIVGTVKKTVQANLPGLMNELENLVYKALENFGYESREEAVKRFMKALDERQKAAHDLTHKRDTLSSALFKKDSFVSEVKEAERGYMGSVEDLLKAQIAFEAAEKDLAAKAELMEAAQKVVQQKEEEVKPAVAAHQEARAIWEASQKRVEDAKAALPPIEAALATAEEEFAAAQQVLAEKKQVQEMDIENAKIVLATRQQEQADADKAYEKAQADMAAATRRMLLAESGSEGAKWHLELLKQCGMDADIELALVIEAEPKLLDLRIRLAQQQENAKIAAENLMNATASLHQAQNAADEAKSLMDNNRSILDELTKIKVDAAYSVEVATNSTRDKAQEVANQNQVLDEAREALVAAQKVWSDANATRNAAWELYSIANRTWYGELASLEGAVNARKHMEEQLAHQIAIIDKDKIKLGEAIDKFNEAALALQKVSAEQDVPTKRENWRIANVTHWEATERMEEYKADWVNKFDVWQAKKKELLEWEEAHDFPNVTLEKVQKREAQQKAEIIAFSQQNYTDQNRIDQDKATAELAKQNQIAHEAYAEHGAAQKEVEEEHAELVRTGKPRRSFSIKLGG